MNIDTFIGAALGSIITIIATKLLEMWVQGREHNYTLQKVFFEKKLAAAELAVSKWYSLSSSITSLSSLYTNFSDFVKVGGGDQFKIMNDSYNAQIVKINDSASQITNAVYLYFDLESDTSTDKGPTKTLFDALVVLQDISISVLALQDLETKESNPAALQFISTEYDRLLLKIKEQLDLISSLLDSSQKELLQMMKTVKQELKKYNK